MDLDSCQNILVLESSPRGWILGKRVLDALQKPGPGVGLERTEIWKCSWGSWAPSPFQAATPASGSWLGWIRFLSLPLLLLNHNFKSLCQRLNLCKFMRSCCLLCRRDFAPWLSTLREQPRLCCGPTAGAGGDKRPLSWKIHRDRFKWSWRDLWWCCCANGQGKGWGREAGGVCPLLWDLWVCTHQLYISGVSAHADTYMHIDTHVHTKVAPSSNPISDKGLSWLHLFRFWSSKLLEGGWVWCCCPVCVLGKDLWRFSLMASPGLGILHGPVSPSCAQTCAVVTLWMWHRHLVAMGGVWGRATLSK